MTKLSVGKQLFWGTLLLFLAFAIMFIVFQQQREKQFKIDVLNLHLQDYNYRLYDKAHGLKTDEKIIDRFIRTNPIQHIRVTMIDADGNVF